MMEDCYLRIPTAITAAERNLLRELATDSTVVEIGSLLGHSTVVMALVAKCVYAIDPHAGYPENDPRPTLSTFIQNICIYGVAHKVIPVISRGQSVLQYLRRDFFDLVFIDTMGDYDGTRDLLEDAISLNPRHIAVHDYGRIDTWDCKGVEQAVHATLQDHVRWCMASRVDTIAILHKREDAPPTKKKNGTSGVSRTPII